MQKLNPIVKKKMSEAVLFYTKYGRICNSKLCNDNNTKIDKK